MTTFPAHPDCEACPLGAGCRSVGVPTITFRQGEQGGHLPTDIKRDAKLGHGDALICLGMNPGYEEDEAGVPFIGRSGKCLKTRYLPPILKRLPGLAIYFTNVARCYADKVSTKVQKTCFPLHTIPDLDKIRELHREGRIVLWCLGAVAVEAMSRLLLGDPKAMGLRLCFREHPIEFYFSDAQAIISHLDTPPDSLQGEGGRLHSRKRQRCAFAGETAVVLGRLAGRIRSPVFFRSGSTSGIPLHAPSHHGNQGPKDFSGSHRPQSTQQSTVEPSTFNLGGQRSTSEGGTEEQSLVRDSGSSSARGPLHKEERPAAYLRSVGSTNYGEWEDHPQTFSGRWVCGCPCKVVAPAVQSMIATSTYHPAALLRDGGLQGSVARHVGLLYRVLIDELPEAINPDLVAPFPC